jgi:hypothetical protein
MHQESQDLWTGSGGGGNAFFTATGAPGSRSTHRSKGKQGRGGRFTSLKKKDELNLLDLAKVLRNMHKSTGSSVSSEEPKGHQKEKSEITCLSGRNHLLCHKIPQHQTTADHEWQGD